jgi:nicotinamidase-related amidase
MPTALLVIDVQQALCSGRHAAHEAQALIERINGLTAQARASSVPVFLIQHQSAPGSEFAVGSAGWRFADGLNIESGDTVVAKSAPDSFHKTELQAALQSRGIDHLTICGLQTEYCVDTTTRRALALGYPVTLVSDAHSTTDSPVLTATQIVAHHNLTLGWIESFGPRATPTPAAEVRFDG